MSDHPIVRIECDNGQAWKTTVTVDGVMIPCTSVTWIADNMSGLARAVLEVPRVFIDAKVNAALVSVVEVDAPGSEQPKEGA